MAVESIGRTDDGIAWVVHHRLGGQWWWTMRLPDGAAVQSPDLYDTEAQALAAVEDARRQALAGLPPVETMASLRARAEAAEAALRQAHTDLRVMAVLGGNIVHERYMRSPTILSDAVLNEWERAEADSAEVDDADLFAVLRRALWVAS